MDETDKKILAFLQGDIPVEQYPYKQLSEELGISENEILARIEILKNKKIIRRYGAVLRHQKSGYNFNAIVAWQIAPQDADKAGNRIVEVNEISHCYLRDVPDIFEYNFFTMIHAKSEADLLNIVEDIKMKTGLSNYAILKSIKEFKKSSMKYF